MTKKSLERCPECGGTGNKDTDNVTIDCDNCNGTGWVDVPQEKTETPVKRQFLVTYEGTEPFNADTLEVVLLDGDLDERGTINVEELQVKK